MTQLKLSLILFCLSFTAFSQNKIDSLKTLITQSEGEEKIDAYVELARTFYISNADSTIFYGEKALSFAEGQLSQLGRGKAYNAIGIGYQAKRDLEKSIEYFQKALELVEPLGDKKTLASIYNNTGSYYMLKNELDKAIEIYIKAIEIEEQLNNVLGLTKLYTNLGMILFQMRQTDRALENYQKALKLAIENNYQNIEIQIKVALLEYYTRMGGLDSAIYYGKSALELSQKNNFLIGVARTTAILSSPLIHNGDFQEGLEVAKLAEESFTKLKSQGQVYLAILNQAYAYEGMKKYALASSIAKKLVNKPFSMEPQVYRLLHKIEKARGNYKQALDYYSTYWHKNDSIAQLNNIEKLAELEKKYQSEKKEREIESLQQKAQIQDLELRQKNIALLVTIVFVVLLAIAGYLIYYQKKLKHERSISDMEQKFLRFQMNPHFIFNSLTSIQNFMFQNDAKKAGIYMAKFAKLMRQILENSRQDFISLDEEVNTLENYLDLQKLRLNNKFTYEINVSEELDAEETKIPPMFAQPFIENALEHGIFHKEEEGIIEVNFIKENNLVKIEVRDNGVGLQASKELDNRQGHKSLATKITQERISLFNKELKDKIKLVIDNAIDSGGEISGTKVNVMVPYQVM